MEDLSLWEVKNYLIEVCKQNGIKVSERQTTRWHYKGLLPKPKQRSRGPGGGRGSETVYPPGTAKQLLALDRIKSDRKRDLPSVGWGLWWEGYVVDMKLIQGFLLNAVSNWEQGIKELFDTQKDQLKPKAHKSINTSLKSHHAKSEHFRRVKRGMGSDGLPGMLKLFLQINTGLYKPNLETAENDTFDVENLLGLEPDKLEFHKIKPRLDKDSLNQISRLIGKTSWNLEIQKSSAQELIQAREEVTQVLMTLESLSIAAETLFGKKLLWLNLLGKWVSQIEPQVQALLVVFWGILGKNKLRGQIEQLLNLCRVWLEITVPHYQALEQLKKEIPSLSVEVTEIMKAIVIKGDGDGLLHRQMQTLYQKHREQLDAFWVRHPEFTSLATKI